MSSLKHFTGTLSFGDTIELTSNWLVDYCEIYIETCTQNLIGEFFNEYNEFRTDDCFYTYYSDNGKNITLNKYLESGTICTVLSCEKDGNRFNYITIQVNNNSYTIRLKNINTTFRYDFKVI
jgi:hypothetical protein